MLYSLVHAQETFSNIYSAASVGEASLTYKGVIISVRKIVVRIKKLEENSMGIAGGGLTRTLVGSTIGKGRDNLVSIIRSAVVGRIAGAFIEKYLKSQDAMEYVVQLTNGQALSVVQGLDTVYSVGERVQVIVSHNGRSVYKHK